MGSFLIPVLPKRIKRFENVAQSHCRIGNLTLIKPDTCRGIRRTSLQRTRNTGNLLKQTHLQIDHFIRPYIRGIH